MDTVYTRPHNRRHFLRGIAASAGGGNPRSVRRRGTRPHRDSGTDCGGAFLGRAYGGFDDDLYNRSGNRLDRCRRPNRCYHCGDDGSRRHDGGETEHDGRSRQPRSGSGGR